MRVYSRIGVSRGGPSSLRDLPGIKCHNLNFVILASFARYKTNESLNLAFFQMSEAWRKNFMKTPILSRVSDVMK